jgi:polyphosphate kinase
MSALSLHQELEARFARHERFNNRELSWLEFNDRVLEEARDASVPILERVKFLAIYASNLDEFSMVRLATVRRQIEAGVETPGSDGLTPREVLARITERVQRAHENIGQCFREQITPALTEAGILLVDEKTATSKQVAFAGKYFHKNVRPLITPLAIDASHPFPNLANKTLYFCAELAHRKKTKAKLKLRIALVLIPSLDLGRFMPLPSDDGRKYLMWLDELIRLSLHEIFPGETVLGCYAIKVVRDAELEFIEEEAQDLLETIAESLQQRQKGPATRFVYDPDMPPRVLEMFVQQLKLDPATIFPGARYHSFSDLMQFPGFEAPELQNPPMLPLPVSLLEKSPDIFATIRQQDILLHHPYQKFDYVVRLLEEAADDPDVVSIKITLYRISKKSPIARALGRAAKQGKQVTAVVELKARFDEETNISWARKLEKDGVHVIYGVPGLKIHCKLTIVTRKETDAIRRYCHLSTGNYNDRTSLLYGDLGMFTCREEIAEEVAAVFDMLTGYSELGALKHLLVAPYNMRAEFVNRIRREVENAQAGRRAGIVAKLNSLVDPEMIDELYVAGMAGVPIRLIVRGICCLKPGVPGLSDNISAVSIIDRFLEHARIYIFENDGQPEYFLASADWMPRNLDRRVEVAFPVLDPDLQRQVQEIVDVQLMDNIKARLLNPDCTNVRKQCTGTPVRSQEALYEMAKRYAG